jgi:hypothetical protein
MSASGSWHNPITAGPGVIQTGVDPALLLPSRRDLIRTRLEAQRLLIQTGQRRHTMIQVTPDGVIYDGHHGVRAAAEQGVTVDVLVIDQQVPPSGLSILALPVR